MSLDSPTPPTPKAKPFRWRIGMGALLVIAVAGILAAQLRQKTSTPPLRELAKPQESSRQVLDSSDTDAKVPSQDVSTTGGEAVAEPEERHKYTNKLINETSPYLLQHAHNPVNWYSWGEEALEKAKQEDKPIFLSVGYSTCYWCHVMEKESFEDEDVAELLNRDFVCIKVDREERPDIDEQYMLATQLVSGRGGWPNSVWLTPDLKPWMAGTYFPKARFMQILDALAGIWKNRRTDATQRAERMAQAIREIGSGRKGFGVQVEDRALDQTLVDHAVAAYSREFDRQNGGFSSRPKFPPHGILRVLLHEYERTRNESQLAMIFRTLDAMWLGSVHDHLGGGFHRYSTDSQWLLPHFEKMLYDNAQLMRAYTDAYALTRAERYREAVEDVFRWLRDEMTAPCGGFYSAIDSGEVGKEGETYIWHHKEVLAVLGDKDGRLFARVYNMEEHGNFTEEATGEQPGTNILHLKAPLDELARDFGQPPDAFKAKLAQLREKLLKRRNTWVQPHKDTKVLTGWNGLMIGALAHAGLRLNEPRYTKAAAEAADFIFDNLVDEQGRLLRTYAKGKAKLPGYLDDYAYLSEGLLDLYQATGEKRWLEKARNLVDRLLDEFEDKKDGGFFFTSAAHEDLLMRSKSLVGGGNVPGGNGVAVLALLELGRQTREKEYTQAAERTLKALSGLMSQNPHGMDSDIYATAVYLQRQAEAILRKDVLGNADASKELGPVKARIYLSHSSVRPGGVFQIAVAMDIGEGWHLYGPNPDAKFLIPTAVQAQAHEALGFKIARTPEPTRKLDPILKKILATHEGRIWFLLQGTVKAEAPIGRLPFKVKVQTQACDANRCLQPRTDEFELAVDIAQDGQPERHAEVFKLLGR